MVQNLCDEAAVFLAEDLNFDAFASCSYGVSIGWAGGVAWTSCYVLSVGGIQ